MIPPTNTERAMTLEDLTLDMIVSAYSGRKGCACGCRGKWRYTSAHQAEGAQARGYPIDGGEVSNRGAALVLSNARKAAASIVEYSERSGTLSVETSERLYIFTTTRRAR
jgi:hypothetical protein